MNKNDSERQLVIRKTLKEYFTPASALLTSEFGLLRLNEVGVTASEAKNIIREAAKLTLSSELLTAKKAQVHEENKLSTGCPKLDTFLRGGFIARGITEIAGESGCGKTQLCLQLLLTVQLSKDNGGFKSGAVYICTEDSFPSQRLHQLITSFPNIESSNVSKLGDHIFVVHIADVDQMLNCLQDRLPVLLSQKKIRLIIVDSIAGIFRGSYNLENCFQRAERLRSIGGILHLLAIKHDICIICINQVTANMKSSIINTSVPSLGLAWANLVTSRLLMQRTDPASSVIVRTIEVLFSPYLPNSSINFVVSENGVKGV